MQIKLELVLIPVTDVDRAKAFYVDRVGFTEDLDVLAAFTEMQPGGIKGIHLVVADIAGARAELAGRGVEVGEIDEPGGSGVKYAAFTDPDGNSMVLQEMAWRTGDFPSGCRSSRPPRSRTCLSRYRISHRSLTPRTTATWARGRSPAMGELASTRGWGSGWPNCQADKIRTISWTQPHGTTMRMSVNVEMTSLMPALINRLATARNRDYGSPSGSYNCRAIADTNRPSNHSWGLACDLE